MTARRTEVLARQGLHRDQPEPEVAATLDGTEHDDLQRIRTRGAVPRDDLSNA
jgi:hypothetical protein